MELATRNPKVEILGFGFRILALLVILSLVLPYTAFGGDEPPREPALAAELHSRGWIAFSAQTPQGDWDLLSGASSNVGEDPQVKSLGTVEVTARLVEIPDDAIFRRDLYDYATILKYEVLAVQRGAVGKGATIYVGHYNPWKPRAEAADQRAKNIGGTLKQFRAGQLHRMALETPMDDHFMGGIVDKYFGKHSGPAYWAVWTNNAE
jgi:hypothetical protein